MQWIVCNVIPEIHEWHHPVWALCAKALGWHFFLFFCVFLNLTFWKLFSAPFSFVYYDPYAFFNRTCNEFKDMEINYYLCSVLILTFSLRKLVLCPRFSNSLHCPFSVAIGYATGTKWLFMTFPMEPELNCHIHDVINIINQIFTM